MSKTVQTDPEGSWTRQFQPCRLPRHPDVIPIGLSYYRRDSYWLVIFPDVILIGLSYSTHHSHWLVIFQTWFSLACHIPDVVLIGLSYFRRGSHWLVIFRTWFSLANCHYILDFLQSLLLARLVARKPGTGPIFCVRKCPVRTDMHIVL